jgi:hypothetical protein
VSDRRDVRVTREFFEQVDRLLPAERVGVVPSRSDFQASDLLTVVDAFRARWDDLPLYVPGRDEWRVLITAGRLVPYLEVVGELALDGVIDLILVTIDLSWPDEPSSAD